MRSDIGGPLVTQRRTDWATKFRLAHDGRPKPVPPSDDQVQQFRENVGKIDDDELKAHQARMEAEQWADETQAFIDGHNDLERAAATREHLATERTVYHLLRQEMVKFDRPERFTLEQARHLVQILSEVPDVIVRQQYSKALEDLGA